MQQKWIKKIRRIVKQADESNGKYAVLSLDPTHPVHNNHNGYLWQQKGKANTKTAQSNTGRRRVTIVGAVNLLNQDIVPLVTETNCDRELIKVFLSQVRKQYAKTKKIYLLLDNASYQRSYEVQEYAKHLNIKLIYLPPYSPNLSLIERVWKFFKKKVLQNCYYEKFSEFLEAIDLFFQEWESYLSELRKLLTLNFETIEKNA